MSFYWFSEVCHSLKVGISVCFTCNVTDAADDCDRSWRNESARLLASELELNPGRHFSEGHVRLH